jgi:iron complex outermembrane receptor protein
MKSVSRNRLSAAVRSALLLSLLPLAAAQAQDENARELDRIEVTGSRIKKAEIETQVPVTTLTREDIARTGLTSVADIVQQLTGSGSSLNTRFNSSGNFGFPPDGSGVGAGSATVDLRHLGSKRVLVLVDGIRWVNEASASGVSASTDLNTIPVAIIERIEVLEDGASSIYGSDAIAGVVNIITRREFDGASASVYYGEFEEGGDTKAGDVAFGGNGDNYSFFVGASITDQDAIGSETNANSAVPVPGTGVAFGSSRVPGGRFRIIQPNGEAIDLVSNAGLSNPLYNPNETTCNRTDGFHCFGDNDPFNFAPFNLLLTPSERKGVFSQVRFDFNESTTWYLRTLYNQRESLNRAAPEPIDLGPGAGSQFAVDVFIPANHPYNPFGFDLYGSGPNANILTIRRRPLEGGPRRFHQDVDTWYFGTGLEGSFDLGDRGFFWDVNYARSSNEAEQTNLGSYNARRIADALGPNCANLTGCVPLDIFGHNTITPEMLAYISPVFRDSSQNDLQLISANITGDLFEMPAGALAFAAGTEYRKLSGAYNPDPQTVAGEYNGVPSLPTAGEYDVSEYYAEFNVPIYAAGDSRLDLSLAGRYSDYSTFGGETTGKAGLRWQFSDQFLLRGTYAEGFRAPSIGELYGAASRFDATITDPCLISVTGAAPTAPAANCAALGVPVGARQLDPQIGIQTGGNVALDPEESDSYSFGFVWSPGFASEAAWSERLDIELTYYNHEIDGAIQAIDAQTQLDLCAETLDDRFCNGIVRLPSGAIDSFNNFLVNFGSVETDGFDFDVFWTLPQTDLGTFRVTWQNTWVNDYEAVDGTGAVQPRTVGIEVNDSGIPEWTSNLGLDWIYGDFSAGWSVRYSSDLTELCGDAETFPVCSDPSTNPDIDSTNRLGSTTYHDLQLGWKAPWFKGTQFTLGINNVFSKEPPICLSCSLNGYDPSVYDLPAGRFMYAKAEVKF